MCLWCPVALFVMSSGALYTKSLVSTEATNFCYFEYWFYKTSLFLLLVYLQCDFWIVREVWVLCAVLHQKGKRDPEKFYPRYERPVQVIDVSLPGILLQRDYVKLKHIWEPWTVRRAVRYYERYLGICRAPSK